MTFEDQCNDIAASIWNLDWGGSGSNSVSPYPAMVYEYGDFGIDKIAVPADHFGNTTITVGDSSNPVNPQPQFDHCEYCGTKTFPTDRCCVACGAPV